MVSAKNLTQKIIKYDVLVIGSGPGGEGAAMQASKSGLKVAIVEKMPRVGGNCTHYATIPSKTIRHMAHRFTMFQSESIFAPMVASQKVYFTDLIKRAHYVIGKQVDRRQSHYFRNQVDLYHAYAKFIDEHHISLEIKGKKSQLIEAKKIIVATGSSPFQPSEVDFACNRVYDSDSILKMQKNPKTITIYGAGVVGCEYASIFQATGMKVNLINSKEKVLPFLDSDISDSLTYHLREQGVIIRHKETLKSLEEKESGLILTLKSGRKIFSDALLVTLGRKAILLI